MQSSIESGTAMAAQRAAAGTAYIFAAESDSDVGG